MLLNVKKVINKWVILVSKESFENIIEELKVAGAECVKAQLALHDLGAKYAPLCIKALVEARHIPQLRNGGIEKRKNQTGLDPLHPDFWDINMIIALSEHFDNLEVADD